MFMYSEDVYFSKSIEKEVLKSNTLCDVGKTGQDILSYIRHFDPFETLKKSHDLDKRHKIPNLLSESYKLL